MQLQQVALKWRELQIDESCVLVAWWPAVAIVHAYRLHMFTICWQDPRSQNVRLEPKRMRTFVCHSGRRLHMFTICWQDPWSQNVRLEPKRIRSYVYDPPGKIRRAPRAHYATPLRAALAHYATPLPPKETTGRYHHAWADHSCTYCRSPH